MARKRFSYSNSFGSRERLEASPTFLQLGHAVNITTFEKSQDSPKERQDDETLMPKILFAVRPQMLRDALARQLATQPDVQIVGDVDNDLDLLLAVRATKADAVVHSWPSETMPAIYSHLFQEYPGLIAIGLTEEGEVRHCQQRIIETPLADGLASMVSTLAETGRRQRISA